MDGQEKETYRLYLLTPSNTTKNCGKMTKKVAENHALVEMAVYECWILCTMFRFINLTAQTLRLITFVHYGGRCIKEI